MSAIWIKSLNESNGRLDKEEVLKKALVASTIGSVEATNFLKFVKYCYDPYTVFGVKQVSDTNGLTGKPNPWYEFELLLQQLSERTITGNTAKTAIIETSKKFDSEEWNLFCAPVLRKDLRSGISDKTINKICKGTQFEVPIFGCQLATNCEGRPEMRGLKRLEPKLDGVRVLVSVSMQHRNATITCHSRNGKEYYNFDNIWYDQLMPHIGKITSSNRSLTSGFVLDGEVVSKSFNDLMTQVHRKRDAKVNDAQFGVFDIIPLSDFYNGECSLPLSSRLEILEENKNSFEKMPNIFLLPSLTVDLDTSAGKDQFERYCNDKVNSGYEGVMIKDLSAPYVCKRNTNWLKYKPVHDYDLQVVDLEVGTGKNLGRLGALICEGVDDGKFIRVNVGSGFTDEQREEFWNNKDSVIGQTVVVMADAISKNQDDEYSLRFPRFKGFREDK
jgi:DNA ligase-1